MLASTDAERDQLATLYGAVAERVEIVPPGVDHSVFFPDDARVAKRPARPRRPAACCCSSAASSRSRASTSRCAASPSSTTPTRSLAGRRRSERPRRRRRARPRARRSRTSSASPRTCASCRPSRTTASPTSTARPTCASCRRAPSRSGSSRSKPPRAARRWSRRRSAGCVRSSTTATTGFLVDGRDPAAYAAPVATLLDDPELAAEMGATRVGALAAVLVEHHRGAPAPSLRRPRRAGPRALRLTAAHVSDDRRDLALDEAFRARSTR